MRTTLDIEDDVLFAAKEVAKREKNIKEMQKELSGILKLEGIKFEEITNNLFRKLN